MAVAKTINLTVFPSELRLIDRAARADNVSRASFMRRAILEAIKKRDVLGVVPRTSEKRG
jgi:uncharacterized protein (DUF1778 family)